MGQQTYSRAACSLAGRKIVFSLQAQELEVSTLIKERAKRSKYLSKNIFAPRSRIRNVSETRQSHHKQKLKLDTKVHCSQQ
jgi:hypothetical protein